MMMVELMVMELMVVEMPTMAGQVTPVVGLEGSQL